MDAENCLFGRRIEVHHSPISWGVWPGPHGWRVSRRERDRRPETEEERAARKAKERERGPAPSHPMAGVSYVSLDRIECYLRPSPSVGTPLRTLGDPKVLREVHGEKGGGYTLCQLAIRTP